MLSLLLLAEALAVPPAAPKLALPVPAYAPEAAEICYPSGLLVQVVNRPHTNVVSVSAVVGGGTSAETEATRGAAHLVEHLWFRSRPAGGPSPWAQEAGLQLDGVTLPDATVYTTVGAPADLAGLLAWEGQRLTNPLQGITAADVVSERAVVLNELAWRGEHAERAAYRYLDAYLWPVGHPYATSTTPAEQAAKLTLDAVTAYAKAAYRPENTSIRIEGTLDFGAVTDALHAGLPPALTRGAGVGCDRAYAAATPPPPRATALATLRAPTWKKRIYVAWSLPPGFGPDDTKMAYAVDVLEDLVWTRLPWVRGVADAGDLTVGCSFQPGRLASEAVCAVGLPDGADPAQAHAAVLAALPRQWLPDTDLDRRRSLAYAVAGGYSRAWEGVDRFDGDTLASRGLSTWFRRVDPMPALVAATFAVDVRQVEAFAKQWLTAERAVAVALIPGGAPVATSAGWKGRARLDGGVPSPWRPISPDYGVLSAHTLTNGARVWVANRPDAPYQARTKAVFRGGWGDEPTVGATEVLDQLLRYTIPIDFDELRLKLAMDFDTTHGARRARNDTLGAAGNLDLQLWVQRYLVDAMSVDLAERQAILDADVEDAFEAFRELPWATSDHVRLKHLLGLDSAALPWWERIRQARSVSGDVVRGWQNTLYRPANTTVVVTGPLGPDEVVPVAERYLGGWKAGGKPLSPTSTPLMLPPPPRVFAFEAPTTLAHVSLTCRLPARTRDNDASFDVLDAVVRRGLWQSLREDGGLYGFGHDRWHPDARVGLLQLDATAPPGDGDLVAAVLLDLVAKIRGGPTPEVMASGKIEAAGVHARRFASAAATASALDDAATDGLTLPEVAGYPARLAAVGAPDVAALLADCAGHEAVSVIGPPDSLPAGAAPVDWATLGAELAKSLR